jgi:hypothetical protein
MSALSLYEVVGHGYKGGLYAEVVEAASPEEAKKVGIPKVRMLARGKAISSWGVSLYMSAAEVASYG